MKWRCSLRPLLLPLLVLTSTFKLCLTCHGSYGYTTILQGPQSVNASLGETATFNCIGRGNAMAWLIDGTNVNSLSSEMIELHGIKVDTVSYYYTYYSTTYIYTYHSSINMTASCINHFTTVECRVNTCWNQRSSSGSLIVEDYSLSLQPPNTTTIGQDSILFHLDATNTSYDVTVVDLSNGSIVTNLTVYGNSNAYKLELVDPDPCHLYNISMELNKCTFDNTTFYHLIATFESIPFKVDNDSMIVNYISGDPVVNVSFKLEDLTMCPGKNPSSFLFQLINVVSNVVKSVNASTIKQNEQGNYTASLGIELQPNSDYILNVVTQNSVGSSISGPFEFSTHKVQDLVVTISTQQVCVACVLADWANTNSCQVTIYSEMTQTIKLISILSTTNNTLMNCTENIPPGYYHIIAYDTENVYNPAVRKYQYLATELQVPLMVDKDTVVISYKPYEPAVNLSFKLMKSLNVITGKNPSSFLFQLINVVSNVVESVNALTITQNEQGNYTATLGVVLQPNSDYILNIITQNSVGSSISGPYKFSTHEVQDLAVTINAQQACVACVLADWANTNSCQVTVYSEMTQTIKSILSTTTNTLMNCTENIPPGYYHIIAYDTDNVSNPAVRKYQYLNTTLPQVPFEVDRETVDIIYKIGDSSLNVSFKLMGNLMIFPEKNPNSFTFELINVVYNAVESINILPVQNEDNYSASLGVVLQPNSEYILNIITQNSVGSSISGPFEFSTHEVQDLVVTINAQQVCVACVLADWANTNSCQVTIYSEMTQTIKSISILSTTNNTLMNCTENIPPGYYHIIAYDTDNVSNPAVRKYHYLNTTLPQDELQLTSTIETMQSQSQTTMIINTTPATASENIQQIGFLAGIAVLAAIALLAVGLLLAMCLCVCCSRCQQTAKSPQDECSAAVCVADEKMEIYEEMEMDTNNTYEVVNIPSY